MVESDMILRQADELKARLALARPLPKEALGKIEEALAIEYTYESNRIEGGTAESIVHRPKDMSRLQAELEAEDA